MSHLNEPHFHDSFHVDRADQTTVSAICAANIEREARLLTDESRLYGPVGSTFASHERVHHAKGEYVRGAVHTNTVEGYYSIFKRGMKGVYQHASRQHLHRYCIEFDFRYSNRSKLGVDDVARFTKIVEGVVGKRLMYRHADREAIAEV